MYSVTRIVPRKKIRLADDNYYNGYYYVTICTQNRLCLFGEIKDEDMILNAAGQMVQRIWSEMSGKYVGLERDVFVVMPNHLHGILIINSKKNRPAQGPAPTLLFDIIRNFKSLTTHYYVRGVQERKYEPFEQRLWQRSYYEHIIRTNISLDKIREYIVDNPRKWGEDRENPINL